MNTKLISVILLLSIISCASAQSYARADWAPFVDDERVDAANATEAPCDQTVCVEPCPGAAPPRYCPSSISKCDSGCACMLECQSPTYVCFQTKFCISRRRFLNKKPTPAIVY